MATPKRTSTSAETRARDSMEGGSDAIVTVKCTEHPTDDITRYCKDHNALCCQFCFLNHRHCPSVQFITDIVHDKPLKTQFQEVVNDLCMVKADIELARKTREVNKDALGETQNKILSTIDALQEKLNTLRKKAITEMHAMKDECASIAIANIKKCDKVVDEITKQLHDLDVIDPDDEVRMFIDIQRAMQKISYGDALIEELSDATEVGDFKLTTNAVAEIFLTMETLGDFARTSCASEVTADRTGSRHTRPDGYQYKIRGRQSHVAKLNEDKKVCDIRGSCQLSSGQLLLIDYNNRSVKLVNATTYDVVGHCSLRKSPFSICAIDRHKAAICLDSFLGDTIVFVHVKNNAILNCQYIDVNLVGMKALAYSDKELYVFKRTLIDAFHVFDMNCSLARKIEFGVELYQPKKMAISPDGERIYITSDTSVVLTMTRTGQLLACLNNDMIREASGVCVDDVGNVFVTGKQSNNVCQVSRDGHTILSELATAADGLDCPRSVCFDRVNSAIVVASSGKKGCDRFHVFKVK